MGWRRSDKEMERLSLDSSVAIKWFSKEEDSEKALKFLNAYINGNIIFRRVST
jgi:predicted nucleic acid-binding protein